MASQTSDRQRMSNDLRELAKLAPGQAAHRFPTTTESSGYFDLSTLLATDTAWPDRERERERTPTAAVPLLRRTASRPIAVPSHETVASVAFEAPEETRRERPSRGRKTLYALLNLASVGVVGYLAFTLSRHPPPPATTVPETTAAAAPVPTTDPAPLPATTAAATPTASSPVASANPTTANEAAARATPTKSTWRAPRAVRVQVATDPTPAPAHVAAARPAVIPASHPAAGNDSLMDLIKKSVATGK